jgi:hypothetical protein
LREAVGRHPKGVCEVMAGRWGFHSAPPKKAAKIIRTIIGRLEYKMEAITKPQTNWQMRIRVSIKPFTRMESKKE